MDNRARLSVLLIVIALGTGVLVASGVGADPARAKKSDAPPAPTGTFLSEVASPTELKLWNNLGCVTCHGVEARGSPMAPDLTNVIPLYVAKFGPDAADHIAAYLIDPQGAPKLRRDGATFPNPMPPIEKLFGGTKADAATMAGLLVRLAK